MDAQSAIRRCIETFTHNTRFFIVVENKCNLLKPILSRFCEIYVPEPELNKQPIHLYRYNLEKTFQSKRAKAIRLDKLKKELLNSISMITVNLNSLMVLCLKLYEKGFSGLDVIHLLEQTEFLSDKIDVLKKYELLVAFDKVRKELRNEKLLLLFVLNYLFLSSDVSLENMSFM
jgi:hypothetical protein